MLKFIELPTVAGPIKICTLWEFMNEVPQHHVSAVQQDIAIIRKKSYQIYGARVHSMAQSEAYAQTNHLLKLNPASVLVEFKKTTSKIERKGKRVDLESVLNELCIKSMENMGNPTHFFPIGANRYALVDIGDIRLFTKEDYAQSLVCLHGIRNFQVYAPNLKVGEL